MPSGTLREKVIKSVLAHWPLVPKSQVHCIFINKDLSSTSVEQPKTITIPCNFWRFSWKTLTNNFEEYFLCLVLMFLLDDFFTLGENIFTPGEKI